MAKPEMMIAAKRDEVRPVKLQLGPNVERDYVVNIQVFPRSTDGAFWMLRKVSPLRCWPFMSARSGTDDGAMLRRNIPADEQPEDESQG
jgi:hypothetical protein